MKCDRRWYYDDRFQQECEAFRSRPVPYIDLTPAWARMPLHVEIPLGASEAFCVPQTFAVIAFPVAR